MPSVLVTRPEPEASQSASRLRDLGVEVLVSPLMRVVPLDWALPAQGWDAVLITSSRAIGASDPRLGPLLTLPCVVAGETTAEAAGAAGFSDVRIPEGEGVAAALSLVAASASIGSLLHLAGRDKTPYAAPAGLSVTTIETYAAELQRLSGSAERALLDGAMAATLLYSSRMARQFALEADRIGLVRERHHIACRSAAIAAAAGPGWGRVTIAPDVESAACALER